MDESPESANLNADRSLKEERTKEFFISSKSSDFYQTLIPNKHYKSIFADSTRLFCGQFTAKGNMYYCSSQRQINVFDTRDPYNWVVKSEIEAQEVRWTVNDIDVTSDEKILIYTSPDPFVRVVDLETLQARHEMIDLRDP